MRVNFPRVLNETLREEKKHLSYVSNVDSASGFCFIFFSVDQSVPANTLSIGKKKKKLAVSRCLLTYPVKNSK